MPVFSMATMAEESNKNRWIPLSENLYVLRVKECEAGMRPSYNDASVEEPFLKITFEVTQAVDGSDLTDIEGNYPASNLQSVWLNPLNVGFNKKTGKAHKAREILTAIMGVKVEDPVELESWDELVNRKVKAYISVSPKDDGTKTNKLGNFTPVK